MNPPLPWAPKVCLDVDYRADAVVGACLGFQEWTDASPLLEEVVRSPRPAAPYEPGQFWLREMPYLQELLARFPRLPDVVVVDGYVWLDEGRPGLGAHLFDALGRGSIVVGVAKTRFRGATGVVPILRGQSAQPLYVSAAGMDVDEAARAVTSMAGAYRVPTLLGHVDRLSRS